MNCFNQDIKNFDLVVAEDSEFNLTRDRVYVAFEDVNFNLIKIKNDLGEIDHYSTEYFRFYNGERID